MCTGKDCKGCSAQKNDTDWQPTVSDNFQIGPDGAYEHEEEPVKSLEDIKDFDTWKAWKNGAFLLKEELAAANNGALVSHARAELELAGLADPDSDYGGAVADAVIELIRVFSEQGHSGGSAPIVVELFRKLAMWKPLGPITGREEEWAECSIRMDGVKSYQNRRCSALFKDGPDGRAHYIDAIVKRDQRGVCWTGRCWLSEEDYKSGDRSRMISSRGYVKEFPFTPKTFYVDVIDVEVAPDDWESFIKDPAQLDEVRAYYDLV